MEEIIKPYGYIYLTTNLVNGKGYIGKHSVPYHDPKYIGSGGRHFWNAVNKYGRENFINEVLCWCFSEEELNAEEEFLIDFFDCIDSDDFYNEREGGKGGWGKGEHHASYGRVAPNRGVPRSDETKLKLSKILKGRLAGENHPNYGKHLSDETRRKISENHADFSRENHPMYGRPLSIEHRKKISEAQRIRYATDEKLRLQLSQKGKKLSAEHRAKLSESHKDIMSGENNPFYGKHHTQETKDRLSEKLTGRIISEETRAKMSATRKGRSLSDEHKRALSESRKLTAKDTTYNLTCSVCGSKFVSRGSRGKYCEKCKSGRSNSYISKGE